MQCPQCKNTQSIRDCRNSLIYCPQCGLVLTASHEYVSGNRINLPYGFRNGIHQCEDKINSEYHRIPIDTYTTETEHHEEHTRINNIITSSKKKEKEINNKWIT